MTHTKQTRSTHFLSQFHFHIAHILGKKNMVANALSQWPTANAITIAHTHDLPSMIEGYNQDEDFPPIFDDLTNGITKEPYALKEGFLIYGSRLCITKNLHEKVMFESHVPPYAINRGIQPTTQALETCFYWPSM